MNKTIVSLLTAGRITLGLVASSPVHAGATKKAKSDTGTALRVADQTWQFYTPKEISMNGNIIFRVRTDAGGLTASQRVIKIQERLVDIMSDPNILPDDIYVYHSDITDGGYDIYVKDHLLLTVDCQLARANDSKCEQLAIDWAEKLRANLPYANVGGGESMEYTAWLDGRESNTKTAAAFGGE